MAGELLSVAYGTKYPPEAFYFVQRGLDYTVRRIHGEAGPSADPTSRHIAGQQLCLGLRDYAREQYGLLARQVLNHWQVYSCEDFGHIVFAMVDAGLMQKTADDDLDDFCGVFTFGDAFTDSLQLSEAEG